MPAKHPRSMDQSEDGKNGRITSPTSSKPRIICHNNCTMQYHLRQGWTTIGWADAKKRSKRIKKTAVAGLPECILFRGNACRFWTFHELPSPGSDSLVKDPVRDSRKETHHLKGIQLLLDLLRENRCQAVARSRLSPSVILATGPCLVELDTRAEYDGLDHSVLRPRGKVVIALALLAILRGAGAARVGRITTVGSFLCRLRHGRRTSRVCLKR